MNHRPQSAALLFSSLLAKHFGDATDPNLFYDGDVSARFSDEPGGDTRASLTLSLNPSADLDMELAPVDYSVRITQATAAYWEAAAPGWLFANKPARRAAAADGAEPLVYGVEITHTPFDFVSGSLHFARILGDQRHIEGSRRASCG